MMLVGRLNGRTISVLDSEKSPWSQNLNHLDLGEHDHAFPISCAVLSVD